MPHTSLSVLQMKLILNVNGMRFQMTCVIMVIADVHIMKHSTFSYM